MYYFNFNLLKSMLVFAIIFVLKSQAAPTTTVSYFIYLYEKNFLGGFPLLKIQNIF